MYNVSAMGELLIDFTPVKDSVSKQVMFERNPGGAPANVLVAVSKLGGNGSFIGKVGNDEFGLFLKDTLQEQNVDTKGLVISDEYPTTLAFVHLNERGDRSFSFYRKNCADAMLFDYEVDESIINSSKIFHFGSLSLTNEPVISATEKALEYAVKHGVTISYDPNYRPLLWESEEIAVENMKKGLKFANILKVSEEEMELLTGEKDLDIGTKALLEYGIDLILVTLGPSGCFYRKGENVGHLYTYDTKIVDTTGAGDSFLGTMLYQLSLNDDIKSIDCKTIEKYIDFANAAGALCATGRGAIPSIPDFREIDECMKTIRKLII